MNRLRTLTVASLLSLPILSQAAKVDTLDIPSAVMQKSLRAGVVLPDAYAKSKARFPVLYLLHGVVAGSATG